MQRTHLLVIQLNSLLHTCKTGMGTNTYAKNMWTCRTTFGVKQPYKKKNLQHKCTHTHKARQHVLRSPTPTLSDKFWQQHFTKSQSRVGVGEEMEIWLFTQHRTSSKVESIIIYTQHADQWAIDQWSNTKSYSSDNLVTWRALPTMPQLSSQC